MTKSKSSMVTRDITHLATDTLPGLVIQSVFSLLPLGRYLLPLTIQNRYQPTDSSGKFALYYYIKECKLLSDTECLHLKVMVKDSLIILWFHGSGSFHKVYTAVFYSSYLSREF